LLIIYCISSIPVPYKGLDCLLTACSILKSAGLSNVQLRISGQIQRSDIWSVIKRKIEELDLTKEVVWLGRSSAEAIVSELKSASVFVLPSYVENSPNALCEAMAVGTPCIASYAGGIPSLVRHGEDGLLFSPGDAYSLAAMISQILRDPVLAKTLSHNAKNAAQKRHDPRRIASTMMNIYSDIVFDSSVKKRRTDL
jgi:glycosyltransferase involved in cell wall biosynthesis